MTVRTELDASLTAGEREGVGRLLNGVVGTRHVFPMKHMKRTRYYLNPLESGTKDGDSPVS